GAGVLASTTILWLGRFFEDGVKLGTTVIPLATATGLFVALRTVASVAGAPAAGYISDRIGRRWWVAALTLALGSAGLASMNFNYLLPAALGAIVVAVSAPAVQALSPAIIGDDLKPQRRSRALGIVFSFGDLGSALGPPIAFALLPLVALEGVYYLCAGLLFVTAVYGAKRALREPKRGSVRN
ncbi:MAG: MFS transporter, partial [Anaerolineales bacterium]|nr:MFS transporter [Anaerolineales bacterium]